MLTDSQNSTDQVLEPKTESIVNTTSKKLKSQETKYQCVVCRINKISLSELHWHQTYQHSTEELSLSIIGWKGIVKIVGPPSSQEKENSSQQSIWTSFSKKPSQFYYLSSTILRVKENLKENLETPIDCSLPSGKVKEIKTCKPLEKKHLFDSNLNRGIKELTKPLQFNYKKIKRESLEAPLDCSLSSVKVEEVEIKKLDEDVESINQIKNHVTVDSNTNKNSYVIPKELKRIKEISMEDFVKGANELCKELEEYKKITASKKSGKRKHIF